MHNLHFDPIAISLGRIGTTRIVTSVREAAECMMSEEWPAKGAQAAREARATLLATLEGKADAEDARAAFERAAKAAGIFRVNLRGR